MLQTIIDIKDLHFAYNGEVVLTDVNLRVREKDFVAIIGPNGGGKSTLLKLMLGLLRPLKGSIHINGKSPLKASPCVGYVPQDVHINRGFPITVIDVVLMGRLGPTRRRSRQSSTNRRDAIEALERMGMADHADRKIGLLSGGQRQRVFIARALATNPELLLLDEPAASIDTKGRVELYKLLKELNKDITVVVVSHDLLVISQYIKSVACVNKSLHFHDQTEITSDILGAMYLCSVEEICPVEMVSHGLLHSPLPINEKSSR